MISLRQYFDIAIFICARGPSSAKRSMRWHSDGKTYRYIKSLYRHIDVSTSIHEHIDFDISTYLHTEYRRQNINTSKSMHQYIESRHQPYNRKRITQETSIDLITPSLCRHCQWHTLPQILTSSAGTDFPPSLRPSPKYCSQQSAQRRQKRFLRWERTAEGGAPCLIWRHKNKNQVVEARSRPKRRMPRDLEGINPVTTTAWRNWRR